MTTKVTWTNPNLTEDQAVALAASIERYEKIWDEQFKGKTCSPKSDEFSRRLELMARIAFSKAALNPDTTFTPSDLFDDAD